jgi:hypothetical protein
MSMIKVIQPNSQDFSEPVAALVKLSSRGLLGADRVAFIKRAGADFAEKLNQVKFASDEIPVHMIAIGATEDYGPNRNADGFTRAACQQHHNTFEKFAKFYRDHLNKDPAKSYGVVKVAAWNEPMKRIELICALNGSKEAAARNGGLLADREMEKLARGEDIGVSMACKIPFDVCSSCGNHARTRAEYCDSVENGGMCKAGGLKHNLGRVLENGHILHADNPDPTFFDISHVFRPADRIAYIFGKVAHDLEKAASAGVLSGSELAEQLGVSAPAGFDRDLRGSLLLARQLDALEKLAAAEIAAAAAPQSWTQVALSSAISVQPPISLADADNVKLAEALRALGDAGVVLPVRDFLSLVGIKHASADLVRAVSVELDGVFSKLASDPDITQALENNAFSPAGTASAKVRMWAEKVALTHSVRPQAVEKRAYQAVLRDARAPELVREKGASSRAAGALARQYALYKIAACATLSEKTEVCWLTANHCVLQNYIT